MKIIISGSNGYIGRNLKKEFKQKGHICISLDRMSLYDIPALTGILRESDAVIHLAGAPILQRWTKTNKTEILDSRVITTKNITNAINLLPENKRPNTFISASAVGIYSPDQVHTESSTSFSGDFVGEVVKQWEAASEELDDSVRKIIFRIGLVVGKEAKTMTNLLPIFKLGLGGKIGSGKQSFPFVHIEDVIQAILWVLSNQETTGIYNLVAPERINNLQFTKAISKSLKRPAFFTVPEIALKLVYGEAASLLFQSPEVIPERLIKSGFKFQYPDIQSSLKEIIS